MEIGLATDAEHVLLSEEQGWNREKSTRRNSVVEHARYWGHGWYILPNPMHGSWTGVL